jgi:hypothetical protein
MLNFEKYINPNFLYFFLDIPWLYTQEVHTETMGSIPDNERKYDIYLWEVHILSTEST